MPLEYNWVGDCDEPMKLNRESRRGEWEKEGRRDGERERGAEHRS